MFFSTGMWSALSESLRGLTYQASGFGIGSSDSDLSIGMGAGGGSGPGTVTPFVFHSFHFHMRILLNMRHLMQFWLQRFLQPFEMRKVANSSLFFSAACAWIDLQCEKACETGNYGHPDQHHVPVINWRFLNCQPPQLWQWVTYLCMGCAPSTSFWWRTLMPNFNNFSTRSLSYFMTAACKVMEGIYFNIYLLLNWCSLFYLGSRQ